MSELPFSDIHLKLKGHTWTIDSRTILMWPWSREGGLERPRGFRDCTGFLATRTWGDWRFQAAVQQPSYVELRQPDKCIFIWVQYIWFDLARNCHQENAFQPLCLPLRTSVMASYYKICSITPNVPKCVRSQKQQQGVYCLSVNILYVLTSSLHILCVYSVWTVSVFSKPAPVLKSYCGRVSALIPED